jgi:hypothetical protein
MRTVIITKVTDVIATNANTTIASMMIVATIALVATRRNSRKALQEKR